MIYKAIFLIVLVGLSANLIATQGLYQVLFFSLSKLKRLGQ